MIVLPSSRTIAALVVGRMMPGFGAKGYAASSRLF